MNLIAKMKIRPEQPLLLVGVPDALQPLFASVSAVSKLPGKFACSQVVVFARDKKELDKIAPRAMELLGEDGLFWIAYPKKSGAIRSDLVRDDGWETMYQSDWEGVASISIDEDWTGMRFRHKAVRKEGKRLPPVENRRVEGIDYINRTVSLPADALKMMQLFKGLEAFFDTLSFTCRKEYVEAIVQAKKPETRLRRIEKMIMMVGELKEKKDTKTKSK